VRLLLLPESCPRDVLAAKREQQRDHSEQPLTGSDHLIDHRHDLVRCLSATDLKCVKALTTDYADIADQKNKARF
jgi:hypothetical protein